MKPWALALVLLAGCSASNGERHDVGVANDVGQGSDAGPAPLQCGAHTVVRGGCAARCPAPCVCVTVFGELFDPSFVPFELCATRCNAPGSCPGTERCSVITYGYNPYQQPVCLPGSLQTPGATQMNVDCFPNASIMAPRCLGDYLVQYQPFSTSGGASGSYCVDVLLELCPDGCIKPDAGAPECRGAPDAGPPADGGVTCCPVDQYGDCRATGGAKLPPHGCRVVCCALCQWTAGKDTYGCATSTPVPQDAGAGG